MCLFLIHSACFLVFGARKAKEKAVEGRPSRAYIFAKFKDVSDAVMCVTLAGGLCQSLAKHILTSFIDYEKLHLEQVFSYANHKYP